MFCSIWSECKCRNYKYGWSCSIGKYIKLNKIQSPIIFVGSYIQALPIKTLKDEKSIDIVCTNEGVYTIHNLINLKKFQFRRFKKNKGYWF